jgi:hypothetical protein
MAEAVRTTSTPSASTNERLFGHGVAVLLGLLSLVGGVASLAKGLPPVMGVTMLVVGVIVPVLVWKSWGYSRAAWSFLIATIAVFAGVMLFGAPKIANVLGIDMVWALVFPAVEIACVVALASLRRDYRV